MLRFLIGQIYNWVPQVFNETRDIDIPNEEQREIYQRMPQSLRDAITRTKDTEVIQRTLAAPYVMQTHFSHSDST